MSVDIGIGKVSIDVILEALEAGEDLTGFCRLCGERAENSVEPDAERYPCEACGAHQVFGAEQLLLMAPGPWV